VNAVNIAKYGGGIAGSGKSAAVAQSLPSPLWERVAKSSGNETEAVTDLRLDEIEFLLRRCG
jgi:hypothetical protein